MNRRAFLASAAAAAVSVPLVKPATAMTIEDLRAYIESRFPVGQGTRAYSAVTGEPYVVIGYGDPLCATDNAAIARARDLFDLYAMNRTGTLYWRYGPALDRFAGGCRVYMRLLISDAPVLPKRFWADLV